MPGDPDYRAEPDLARPTTAQQRAANTPPEGPFTEFPGMAQFAENVRPYMPSPRDVLGALEAFPPDAAAARAAAALTTGAGRFLMSPVSSLESGFNAIVNPAIRTFKTALGSGVSEAESAARTAREAATGVTEGLRAKTLAPVTQTVEQEAARAAEVQKRLDAIASALAQLAERDVLQATVRPGELPATLAEQRAAHQAGAGAPSILQAREGALSRLRERANTIRAQIKILGGSELDAQHAIAEAEERSLAARAAAENFAAELSSRPTITKEEFGSRVRSIVQNLHDRGEEARSKAAGFNKAVSEAPEGLIVPTKDIIKNIYTILERTANPEIENPLKAVISRLTTPQPVERLASRMTLSGVAQDVEQGTENVPAMTLERADSLRKWLNQVISSKKITLENGGQGSVSAAIRELTDIRDSLSTAAGEAHKPYKKALETWARLSDPLRQTTGKGALRRIIQTDTQAREELLGTADVVGHLINQAKSGKPVITSLIAEDPELVNAARYYFNRRLFSGQTAPSVSRLDTFLGNNEGVLRQFGLYDEFKTLAGARAAGDKAIAQAGEAIAQAQKTARQIAQARKTATQAETATTRLIPKQAQRVAEAVPTAAEDIAAARAKRATQAAARLEKQTSTLRPALTKAQSRQREYQALETELAPGNSTPTESVAKAKVAAKKMFDDGIITQNEYNAFLGHIQEAKTAIERATETEKTVEAARTARAKAQRNLLIAAGAVLGARSAAHTAYGYFSDR